MNSTRRSWRANKRKGKKSLRIMFQDGINLEPDWKSHDWAPTIGPDKLYFPTIGLHPSNGKAMNRRRDRTTALFY